MTDTTNRRSLILGTAGHIDHGKSTLIQALTGTDPDRLAEEKARGITIQLGFAQLTLPSGTTMGVVDVPGHEKFVRQMVAGASGVDVALLVIAADDGIMPQTTEHLAVLQLLAVPSCVVALTKCDTVDDDWTDFVSDEIATFLEETPYAHAPIIKVSSVSGQGLDQLKEAIDEAAGKTSTQHADGPTRMPIDRAFTIKGAGTVVTGTLWSGHVAVDDDVVLLPGNSPAHVRSVQNHGTSVEVGLPGNRIAVNLSGVKADEVHAGDFMVSPQAAASTDHFDATITFLGLPHSTKQLKSGTRVHIAHGTREVCGRVLLVNDKAGLDAGQTCYAQIRLDDPLCVRYGDRFIIRSYSPTTVIGGGRVLLSKPKRRSNLSPDEKTLIKALDVGDLAAATASTLSSAGVPLCADDIAQFLDMSCEQAERLLKETKAVQLPYRQNVFYCDAKAQRKWISAIQNALTTFHYNNPRLTGMSTGGLKDACKHHIGDEAFAALLAGVGPSDDICVSDGKVSHAKVGAGARMLEEKTADEVSSLLAEAGSNPPLLAEIQQAAALDKASLAAAMLRLCSEDRAVRVNETLYYDSAVYRKLLESAVSLLKERGACSASELKDAMGVSRKYAIPLLEHFDATGVTRRKGDGRELIGG